jgi:HpiC1 cyclase
MKKIEVQKHCLITALLILTTIVTPTGMSLGSELSITNQSFETPPLGDGSYTAGNVPGWTGVGTFGMANPANNYFLGTSDSGGGTNPLHGINAAWVNVGGKLIYQNPGLTVEPGVIYRLTLLVGRRIGVPLGYGAYSFWAGTNLLAEGLSNPADNRFVAASLTYTSPPSGSLIAQPLRIELRALGTDSQAWFDDVHLYAEGGGCTPHKATAIGQLVNGIFVGATITEPGCGYTNAPVVLIKGGGGSGAMATAVISDGRLTEIRVTNGGCCYTNTPQVVIGSPPFVPTLSIDVSKVNVTQNIVLGWKYVLESSTNNMDWTATGPAFVADSETITTEVDVDTAGRYFRLRVVP